MRSVRRVAQRVARSPLLGCPLRQIDEKKWSGPSLPAFCSGVRRQKATMFTAGARLPGKGWLTDAIR